MQLVADQVWMKHYPLTVLGTHHGRNVTVIRLSSGKTVIHSMAPFTAADVEEIRALGTPGWLVEAMMMHDTYAKEGRAAFPNVPFLGPPGFSEVVGFPTLPLTPAPQEWQGEIEVIPIAGAPKLQEQLTLHLPSRTLIVADLVFNFPPHEGAWDRFFHRYLAGMKRYPAMSRIFRLFVKDRTAFLASIKSLLQRDFDRIIVGHGIIVEREGRQLLRRALMDAGFPPDL